MSVKARVMLVVVGVFVIGMLALAAAGRQSYILALDSAARQAVTDAASTLTLLQDADTAKLSAALRVAIDNDQYRDLFLAGDREGLFDATKPVFDDLKADFFITHWYFETTEESPTVFLRVHKPEQFGDALTRKTYQAAVASKSYGAGLELGKTAVALRVVHPFYDEQGETIIGYMEFGQEIERFLGQVKDQTGDDTALLLVKASMDETAWAEYRSSQGLENNWDDHPDYVLAAATSEAVANKALTYEGDISALPEQGEVLEGFSGGGEESVIGIVPVDDVADETIGGMIVDHDISEVASSLMRERLITLAVILAMLLALMAVILVVMNKLIFNRLDGMIEGMEEISTRLAGGDFDVHYQPDGSSDEIGRFEDFFARFIDSVASTLRQLMK